MCDLRCLNWPRLNLSNLSTEASKLFVFIGGWLRCIDLGNEGTSMTKSKMSIGLGGNTQKHDVPPFARDRRSAVGQEQLIRGGSEPGLTFYEALL
jgi:hypothetical protein